MLLRSRHQEGGLLTLPPEGKLYVLADLHGDKACLETFLAAERIEQRLATGEPLQVLSLGDVSDGIDDIAVCARLEKLKSAYPDNIHVLLGNHDAANLHIYDEVGARQLYSPGITPRRILEAFRDERPYLYQFSTVESWVEGIAAGTALFEAAPLVARTANGLAFVHAGPAQSPLSPGYFSLLNNWSVSSEATRQYGFRKAHGCAASSPSPAYDMLWGRCQTVPRLPHTSYDKFAVRDFLQPLGADVLVVGHEPLMAGGVCFVGNRLVVLETATACRDAAYLELELNPALKKYDSSAMLEKAEIKMIPH